MSEDIQKKVEELAKLAKEKLGVDEKEVMDKWETEKELVKTLRPDLKDDAILHRAFLRLKGHWKKELRSPAKFFEGMLIRVATPFDVLRSMHAAAALMYEKDPAKAMAKGLVDADGVHLDPRPKYSTGRKNEDYGKPLPPNRYIQNIMGIAKTDEMAKPVVFTMVLSERLAGQLDIPIFTPVKFRANPAQKQPTDGTMLLNEYSGLRFVPAEIEGFPEPEDVLQQFFAKEFVDVVDLPDWHKENENNPQRCAIVYGDVDDVDTKANPSTGNVRVVLVDEAGDQEVTAWVPSHLKKYVDFAAGSKVIALGRTAQNTYNDELRTMINVEGIYAPSKDKIPLEEDPGSVVSGAQDVS